MSTKLPRDDRQTAQNIKEALAMQRAFGEAAARTFLKLRNAPAEMVDRVLANPEQRRQH